MTLDNFEDVLSMVTSLAMKGCFFVGELPGWLAEKGTETKVNQQPVICFLFFVLFCFVCLFIYFGSESAISYQVLSSLILYVFLEK